MVSTLQTLPKQFYDPWLTREASPAQRVWSAVAAGCLRHIRQSSGRQ